MKKVKRILAVVLVVAVVALAATAGLLIYDKLNQPVAEHVSGMSLDPKTLIETFEISALDYGYTNIVYEKNTEERKFLFVTLKPSIQTYAVQFDGSIKMGINGKDIEVTEQPAAEGEKTVLEIAIPHAYIIAHDAPLNDTCEVVYDMAENAEPASIGQYTKLFNEAKKEIEAKMEEDGYLARARESAKKQLEAFLNAIPGIGDEYAIEFVMAD